MNFVLQITDIAYLRARIHFLEENWVIDIYDMRFTDQTPIFAVDFQIIGRSC